MTEIFNFISALFGWVEKTMFFFLPVLLLIGLPYRGLNHPKVRWFLLFAGVVAIEYIIALTVVPMSRYFLPVLLLWGGFAITAFIHARSWLKRGFGWPKHRIRLVLLCVALIPAIVTGIKFSRSGHKHYLDDFSRIIKNAGTENTVLCGLDTGDTVRIANAAGIRHFSTDHIYLLVDQLLREPRQNNLYLLGSVERDETPEVFQQQFRSLYYVFPFSLVSEATYRKHKYLLYHFNRETGDGISNFHRKNFLAELPSKLQLTPESLNQLDLAPWLPMQQWSEGDFLEILARPLYTMTAGTVWSSFPHLNTMPQSVEVRFYNALFWPESEAKRTVTSGGDIPVMKAGAAIPSLEKTPASTQPPLLLNAPDFMLATPDDTIMLANFTPISGNGRKLHYTMERQSGNFELQNGVLKFSGDSGEVDLTVNDVATATNALLNLKVRRVDITNLKEKQLRVFLLTDSIFSQFRLPKHLLPLLGEGSVVDELCITGGFPPDGVNAIPYDDYLDSLNWPTGGYDIVIVGLFLQHLLPRWELNVTDRTLIPDALMQLRSTLAKRYENSKLLFLLPPGPARGDVLQPKDYRYRRLPLAHYALCMRLQESLRTKENSVFHTLPLFHVIDPVQDYRRTQSASTFLPISSFEFTDDAEEKIAKTVATAVVTMQNAKEAAREPSAQGAER